jgi:serine/threonine-protein kinase
LEERRSRLAASAFERLASIEDELVTLVTAAAPAVEHQRGAGFVKLVLESASLEFKQSTRVVRPDQAPVQPPFDVVSTAFIDLTCPRRSNGFDGRGASLWYCDAQVAGDYGWFETAFMIQPMMGPAMTGHQPFGLDCGQAAIAAVNPGLFEHQVAWPFTRLELEDLGEFIGRWGGWFADAAIGILDIPRQMPERDPNGTWRR